MSDTPRTDAEYERLFEIYQNAERINGPLCCAFENDMRLCGQLERELNAANQRIKQLEEAGDAIVGYNIGCGCGEDGPCRACCEACEEWTRAKEAKP